jgi:hypothetical protein
MRRIIRCEFYDKKIKKKDGSIKVCSPTSIAVQKRAVGIMTVYMRMCVMAN